MQPDGRDFVYQRLHCKPLLQNKGLTRDLMYCADPMPQVYRRSQRTECIGDKTLTGSAHRTTR